MAGLDANAKLLINFNGSDGATTYTAETGQTVTFVGTAQLDTGKVKTGFGTSSLLLDGNSDWVTIPDSADWNFSNAAFTIEAWVLFSSVTSPANQTIFSHYTDSNNYQDLRVDVNGTNKITFFEYKSGFTVYFDCPFTPSADTWYHIALVRIDGGNAASSWRVFVDGVSKTLTLRGGAWSGTLSDFNNVVTIGNIFNGTGTQYFNGNIDCLRISNIARWTSDFTPSTEEYNNITTTIKSIAGLAYASVKKVGGLAIASVKKIGGLA